MVEDDIVSEFAVFLMDGCFIEIAEHVLGEPISLEPYAFADLLEIDSIVDSRNSVQI